MDRQTDMTWQLIVTFHNFVNAHNKNKWSLEVLCFLKHVIYRTNSRLLLWRMILFLRWSYNYFEYLLAIDIIMLSAQIMIEQSRIMYVHCITAVTHHFFIEIYLWIYTLDTARLIYVLSESDLPVGGEIFRTHPGGPWGPPSLLYNGYLVSFLVVKQLGLGVDHPPSSSTKVKERVELYFYSPSGSLWPVLGWPLPLPESDQYNLYFTKPYNFCLKELIIQAIGT